VYGSPELKQKTINHYKEIVMGEMVQRAEQLHRDVTSSLKNLSPAVRVMAGKSLQPVLAMSELSVDMAREIERLKGKVSDNS